MDYTARVLMDMSNNTYSDSSEQPVYEPASNDTPPKQAVLETTPPKKGIEEVLLFLEDELRYVNGRFFKNHLRVKRFQTLKHKLSDFSPEEIVRALSPISHTKYSLLVRAIRKSGYIRGTCSNCRIGNAESYIDSRLEPEVIGGGGNGGGNSNQNITYETGRTIEVKYLVEDCSASCGVRNSTEYNL